jgi:hypothetical protein
MHVLEDTGSSPTFSLSIMLTLLFKIGSGDTLATWGVITKIGGWIFTVTGVADTSLWGMWSFIGWCSGCGGVWGSFELRVVTVNCSPDSPEEV